ncbi:portal protein [Variovorax sp. PMC12]|uniref:portal protein n=1 Tax=Variovorax sp. PMC12 TaxID=2126319 RepID=UPI000D12F068|nr:genomic island protein [Variovorax sp. PMC12]AVQ81660.1 genomic island protein [Variovorax sp. PMC12]
MASAVYPSKNTPEPTGDALARENWYRYLYGRDQGHLHYMEQAQKCEGMYLGGGEQWSEEDKAILTEEGRPFYEFNEIMPSVNSAIGYQIHNRMDIAFKPRGEKGDLATATILSKVTMQIADQAKLHWKETQVFGDGVIQQRGYFNLRMNFDKNIKGEIEVETLDPLDVVPDPDAKSYDPDSWGDVIITRWLTLDEIEQLYGKDARTKAEASGDDGHDWGEMDEETRRNRFGDRLKSSSGSFDAYNTLEGKLLRRYRIVDRQKWVYENTKCLVFPDTGDVETLDNMTPDQVDAAMQKGAVRASRMRRRIKWTVSTYCALLFDQYSPHEHFTVVPYFAYFRRGKTRGMVDNAIGPQEALNKGVSQFIAIVNTAANSGWMVEEESLTNMESEDLETDGAKTGLVVEYRKGAQKPSKIEPNSVPTGIDRLIDRATVALKDVTVPEAMRGGNGPEVAGVAIQSKQFASQQQLAVPLDNLSYTRALLAVRLYKMIQRYYDSHRIFRITETDQFGNKVEQTLEINKPMPDGSYFNDITVGEYDVVVSEQPMQITFENSQFNQALEMKEKGINIPDQIVVRYSNLQDKQEIIEGMTAAKAPPVDPLTEAKAALTQAQAAVAKAQAGKVDAETVEAKGRTMYSALQTAQVIAATPATALLADTLLGSQGFVDADGGTLVPELGTTLPTAPEGLIPNNTNPITPASPELGVAHGIETPENDGVRNPMAQMPA